MSFEDSLAHIRQCLNADPLSNTSFSFLKSKNSPREHCPKDMLNNYFHLSHLAKGIQEHPVGWKSYNQNRLEPSIKQIESQKQANSIELPNIKQVYCSSSVQSNTLNMSSLLSSKNKARQANSVISQMTQLYQSLSNSNRNDDKSAQAHLKENKPSRKPKIVKRLYKQHFVEGLTRQQKYFESSPVLIPLHKLQQLGYYEAGNIYKNKNIAEPLKQLAIKAKRPEIGGVRSCKRNEMFLPDFNSVAVDFSMDQFIKKGLGEEDRLKPTDSLVKTGEQLETTCQNIDNNAKDEPKACLKQQQDIYLTFRGFAVQRDQSFVIFKVRHLEIWGEMQLTFKKVWSFLQARKLNYFKVQASKLLFWHGRKITFETINEHFKLEKVSRPEDIVLKLCLSFKDKLKVRKMRNEIDRKRNLGLWVTQRLKIFIRIRQNRRASVDRAHQLHRQLQKDMSWQVQIFLPSFSVSEFQRNTTQYMQCFESSFHQIWKDSDKALILILPTVNESILKLFQNQIKIKRKISIICPEVHHAFPLGLPLSAQLLYSYATLKRVQFAIGGKKAVLIPGRFDTLKYQLLLSDYLNVPLLASLDTDNSPSRQKIFFQAAALSNPAYCVVKLHLSYEELLETFAQLLLQHPQEKKWIFKLNDQFNGRGIATLKCNPSKYMRRGESKEKNEQLLRMYLRSNLKLKIKINFENSLFMVQNFISQFLRKGGLIEQQLQSNNFLELCFNKTAYCNFLYAFKAYHIDYSNKVWLSSNDFGPGIAKTIASIQKQLEREVYYGFVSVMVCVSGDEVFGVDVKAYQTYSSSLVSLINLIEQRRKYEHYEEGGGNNLTEMAAKRQTPNHVDEVGLKLQFAKYHYLVIPNIIFTDVDEDTKAQIIEDLMLQSWSKHRLNLYGECSVYLSVGVDLSLLVVGTDLKRLKKRAIDCTRHLAERVSSLKKYRGKQLIRDVFQFGDIIRAVTQIKSQAQVM